MQTILWLPLSTEGCAQVPADTLGMIRFVCNPLEWHAPCIRQGNMFPKRITPLPLSLIAKIEAIATDFQGEKVIEASKLQDSRLYPSLFKDLPTNESARNAVFGHPDLVKGAHYVTAKAKRKPADAPDDYEPEYEPYNGNTNQTRCLIKVTHLVLNECSLEDPTCTPMRGRPPKRYKAIKNIWDALASGTCHLVESVVGSPLGHVLCHEEARGAGVAPGEAPAEAEEVQAKAEEAPAEAEKVPTEAEEVPTEAEEVPAEAEEVPAEAKEAPAEAEEAQTMAEEATIEAVPPVKALAETGAPMAEEGPGAVEPQGTAGVTADERAPVDALEEEDAAVLSAGHQVAAAADACKELHQGADGWAPPTIELVGQMHKNMFRLKNGAIVEIRGVPGDQSSIRIKASHLAEVFGVQNIRAVLQSKSTGKYQRGTDFWTLVVPMSTPSFGGHRLSLFVSYACMVQLAVCTRVNKGAAEQFKKLVLDVACIAQTGTQQQREELASSIVEGIPLTTALNHYKSTSANPGAIQVLYLILMGQVGLLRESLNIQTPDIHDDWVVLKVGKSEDYCSRIRRHERGIGTIPGVLLSEVCVVYMDHSFVRLRPVSSTTCGVTVMSLVWASTWTLALMWMGNQRSWHWTLGSCAVQGISTTK